MKRRTAESTSERTAKGLAVERDDLAAPRPHELTRETLHASRELRGPPRFNDTPTLRGVRPAALVVAALLLACTERKYADDYCYAPARPPDATVPYVGLFHRDGRPLLRAARVQVTYGANTIALSVSSRLAAELLPNGRQVEYVVMPPDRAGNLYTFPINADIALYACALPLQYRVEAEGCAPVSGSWSWDDNTYPERLDINFHVPLRLTCTGEDPPPDAASSDAATP